MEAAFSVTFYSSLLGGTTIQAKVEMFLCGPRHATVEVFSM
jgi:hypothetical protein